MALDRQRILNELGSVLNQLQSADCGCMGKLFGDVGQDTASSSLTPTGGGCRQNCCYSHGHRWNSNRSCGEPYPGNAQNTNSTCIGSCNPPKLYADTYNYLTKNLMQPTVEEVYNDLKSLSPDNCIANNQIANQMGLSPNSLAAQGKMGKMPNLYKINADNTYNSFTGQPDNVVCIPSNDANQNQMGQVGGMGPEIMNMVESNMTKQNKSSPNLGQNGQMTGPMESPHGTTNQYIKNANTLGYPNSYNANQSTMQPNIPPAGNVQNLGKTNPAARQMAAGHHHGHHSQGISKFNEIFPGVMNNTDGNLGFDPMAIAIQMNPSNQKQTAINNMKRMMENHNPNLVLNQSTNPASLTGKGPLQNQIQNNVLPNHIGQSNLLQQAGIETVEQNVVPMTYQNSSYIKYRNPYEQIYNQQEYTASSRDPVQNQQTRQPEQRNHQQNNIDPNTGRALTQMQAEPFPTSACGTTLQQPIYPRTQIKDSILPADTTKYKAPNHPKYFEYNTLGQPVDKLSAETYRVIEPSLPQTLSPQPPPNPRTDAAKYSKVKSTVSKTSLMGVKVGRKPSQLQHIYNQYKGSQSYTQQNITTAGVNAVSHSEGKLNAPDVNLQHRQTPVEKVGGDTFVNNQIRDERMETMVGQISDVPASIKSISARKPDEIAPVLKRNTRNGLQDIVYTSYPSAAWTFHGVRSSPCSPGRYRYSK
ncbi:GATA zinc finger domain-containing protein 14-like [Pararge aegeria]|uniref:GATA zinc finger domain-containing protein 14-like n=1 Tax=Pararge aegeria TaxID=116150 RepID=UPI0019CFD2A6|nr:GATA zinc finger domain-containing protein 14-like [Pararge aegeria]